MPFEHGVDRRDRLLFGHGDDDAFAGRKPVGLHDDGRSLAANIGTGRLRILKRFVIGRRDLMTLHESLGKIFRAFKLRGSAGRAENLEPGTAESVHDASGKRRLGADDCQGDVVLTSKFDELVDCRPSHVFKPFGQRRTGIARRHVDLLNAFALRKPPGERMLAAAAADHQNFHCPYLKSRDAAR